MFDSKALKPIEESRPSKFYRWWIETPVADFYYEWSWKLFGKPIQDIKKMYEWYSNVFYRDFDFDAHSVFHILEYKLIRVQKVLDNGWAIQEPKDMKALKLAIKLAKKLKEDEYGSVAHDRVERKYGELKSWTTPHLDPTKPSVRYNFRYENVKTPEEEKASSEFRTQQYLASETRMQREEKWLYAILHKYMRTWWD